MFNPADYIAERFAFTLADALRALGGTPPPGAEHFTICALRAKNDMLTLGWSEPYGDPDPSMGVTVAYNEAMARLAERVSYTLADMARLSPQLQEAIRLELAGLPMGREDVTATNIPALGAPPTEFKAARSATFQALPVAGEDREEATRLNQEAYAQAWAAVRAEIASAGEQFPAHLIGYTVAQSETDPSKPSVATLTVYG